MSPSKDRIELEAVAETFSEEALLRAQRKTLRWFEAVRSELKPGLTEAEAVTIALELAKDLGASRHWHAPKVRFGEGTLLSFREPASTERELDENDVCFLDLGPVWRDRETGLEYEGDYGDTLIFGQHPEGRKIAEAARGLFAEAKTAWISDGLRGVEIYALLDRRARELGYERVTDAGGHRVSDYPHQRFTRENLGRVEFRPSASLWVLEVQLRHPKLPIGAFFEDLL